MSSDRTPTVLASPPSRHVAASDAQIKPPAENPTTTTRSGSTCQAAAFARTVATMQARSASGAGNAMSPVSVVT